MMNFYIVLYIMLLMAGSCISFEEVGKRFGRGWAWAAMIVCILLGMIPAYLFSFGY